MSGALALSVLLCENQCITHLFVCERSVVCHAGDFQGPEHVQALAITLFLRWSLGALTSADSAVRETALRSFLPVLASAAGRLGTERGQQVLQAVWEQCRWACIPVMSDSACPACLEAEQCGILISRPANTCISARPCSMQ